MESKKNKLVKSTKHLQTALKQYEDDKSDLNFLTVAKAFEVLVEYCWRELKREVEDQGLEAPSPKMAVKEAARLNFITHPEQWIECIDARNNSVHDYFGITQDEFCEIAYQLLKLLQQSKTLYAKPKKGV